MRTAKKPNDGEFPHVENRPGRLPTVLLPGGRRRRVSGHCRPRAGGSDCGGPPPSEGSLKRTGSPPKPRPRLPGPHQAVGVGEVEGLPCPLSPAESTWPGSPACTEGPVGTASTAPTMSLDSEVRQQSQGRQCTQRRGPALASQIRSSVVTLRPITGFPDP